MKKKIATVMFTIATACGFAQDAASQPVTLPSRIDVSILPSEERAPKNSYVYVRTDVAPLPFAGAVPGLGIGYRLGSAAAALDFSASIASNQYDSGTGLVWTLPKINYLHYLMPELDNALYIGGGVALGGIDAYSQEDEGEDFKEEGFSFEGLIANAAVGYELQRKERFRSFVQLDVNQPIVAASRDGQFPGPWLALSLGAGF